MKNFKIVHFSKLFFILSFLTITLLLPIQEVKAQQQNITSNLGPFKVGRSFCQQIQKLSAIMNVYSNVTWPVVGFPGVTVGLLQNTSALMDFCNFIIQLETLGTTDAIFYTAAELNKITGNKWDHHLEFMDGAWSLANDVYDFENGQSRKGALKSVSTHSNINNFMNTSYKWFNKTFNDRDVELKTRGQREGDMANLSSAAYQRAILKDAINCPAGDGNVNYQKVYSKEIEPSVRLQEQAKLDLEFFRNQLMTMGPRFLANENELNAYIEKVENIMVNGVTHKTTESTKQIQTTKRVKDKNGNVTDKNVKIDRTTQSFTPFRNEQLIKEFKEAYVEKWSSWVTGQFLSAGSRGLLDDPKGRVENEFRDLAYECNRSKLMAGVSTDRADYSVEEEKRYNDCINNTKVNQKQASNLLEYYANNLYSKLYEYKKHQSDVWTKESKYLGTVRTVSKNTTAGFQQEEVKCSEASNLSQAQMSRLGLKQQDVNNQLTEIIATQAMKQTAMQEAQAKAEYEQKEELSKKSQFVEQRVKDDKKLNRKTITPVMPQIKFCENDEC